MLALSFCAVPHRPACCTACVLRVLPDLKMDECQCLRLAGCWVMFCLMCSTGVWENVNGLQYYKISSIAYIATGEHCLFFSPLPLLLHHNVCATCFVNCLTMCWIGFIFSFVCVAAHQSVYCRPRRLGPGFPAVRGESRMLRSAARGPPVSRPSLPSAPVGSPAVRACDSYPRAGWTVAFNAGFMSSLQVINANLLLQLVEDVVGQYMTDHPDRVQVRARIFCAWLLCRRIAFSCVCSGMLCGSLPLATSAVPVLTD
jgi:hypothetical protein